MGMWIFRAPIYFSVAIGKRELEQLESSGSRRRLHEPTKINTQCKKQKTNDWNTHKLLVYSYSLCCHL